MAGLMEDFGQKIDLCSRIREILVNYPPGGTILKEFVQNADDAGASRITFCLDKRTFKSQSLAHERLAAFQGPALLVHNDGVFSDQDFDSIQNIGDSQKKGLLVKTGRFGIGFNSCYHVTEMPTFLSRDKLVMFDPQAKYLPDVNPANPGKSLNVCSASVHEHYADQLEPYRAFGVDFRGPYKGTLFRLPLRLAEQAKHSKLSAQCYTEESLLPLLRDFAEDAQHSLLFLKNVSSIEVCVWSDHSQKKPSVLWTCAIGNLSKQLRDLRSRIAVSVAQAQAASLKDKVLSYAATESDYELSIDVTEGEGGEARRTVHEWLVCTSCAGGSDSKVSRIACAPDNFRLRLVPWAGVATLVAQNGKAAPSVRGRAFCFLPLPAETGLPVHVNGYFELSSNRRDIWRGDDMAGEGRIRAEWNRALLEDVVAPTYARMILRLCRSIGGGEGLERYYMVWPGETAQEPWGGLVRRVYEDTAGLPVLWSLVGGGRWVSPQEARYVGDDWEHSDDVTSALLEDGEAVVHVPRKVCSGFEMVKRPVLCVSPNWLRDHFKGSGRKSLKSNRHRAVNLLRFCLSDLTWDCKPSSKAYEAYVCLVGLPLVPVSDGALRVFGQRSNPELFFVGTPLECDVLSTLRSRIVDVSLPASVGDHFRSEALQAYTNVRQLTPGMVAECLDQVLPQGWKGKGEVVWKAGQGGHPTEEWVGLLWKYLCGCEGGIGAFVGWPLIPTVEGTLCLLSEDGGKVVDGGSVLGERLRGLLSAVGCRMLDGERIGRREAVAGYVQKATLRGVLAAMYMGCDGRFEQIVEALSIASGGDKRELRAFFGQRRWLNEESCSREDAVIVMSLPIHEVYGEGECFQALDGSKRLPPAAVTRELLTEDYVRAETEAEADMYRFLGVKTATLSHFFGKSLLPRLGHLALETREGAVVAMLEVLPQLYKEDPAFVQVLVGFAFVPTASGKLARPRDLYDPSVGELRDLLEGGDFYPSDAFLRQDLVATLIRLGLQTSLDREGVIKVARSVADMDPSDEKAANRRGTALLRFLDLHYADLTRDVFTQISGAAKTAASGVKTLMGSLMASSKPPPPPPRPPRKDAAAHVSTKGEMTIEAFKELLLQHAWMPVLTKAPVEGLPWTDDRSPLARPSDVRPKEDMWLLSFFMSIVDGEVTSKELRAHFGWNVSADRTLIAAQLVKLSQVPDIAGNAKLQECLNTSVFRIYSTFQAALDTEEFPMIKALLDGNNWIWMGDDFASPDTVAFKCALNARPMLSAVPAEISSFAKLLRAMGVRESFSGADYVRSLASMADAHGSAPLTPDRLELAIAMVQCVADDAAVTQSLAMFCPDNSGVMCPATELVFNDAPWMPAGAFNSDDFCFVHPKISIDVGDLVGVRSLRRQLLLKNSDLLDMGLQDAEAFGQSESLTGRLRNILELYPDGPGIINEMIQNADDARATEVTILVNRKSYPSSSLLSPQMASWQGPAIYFHNNAVFRPQDFANLTRIGQGSKLDCLGKTGKFGLGFNAVYHFTDLPSFVSGEYLAYFDPHTSFLPGATLQHPGLRIKFTRNNIGTQFPDQMLPYMLMGCDLQSHYQGTLFRFPLRSPDVAKKSEVKKDAYSVKELQDLVESFRRVAPDALLFLKHIRTIKICDLGPDDDAPKLVYQVSVKADPPQENQKFFTIPSFVEGPPSAPISKDTFFQVLRKCPSEKLPHSEMTVVIEESDSQGLTSSTTWAVSSAIGSGRAKDIAVHAKTAHLRLVPWAGVAAMLARESQTGKDHVGEVKGRAFCFLPLPAETGLPVHVNGYFELSSNRRDIWRGDDMAGEGRIRAEWNRALLEDVVAPTYARMILRLCRSIGGGEGLERYYMVWPGETAQEPWGGLVRRVYEDTAGLPVLWSLVGGGRWVSPQEARYVGGDWEHSDDVAKALLEAGQAVVKLPDHVRTGFASVEGAVLHADASFFRTFIKSAKALPACVATDRSRAIRLLSYCLGDLILGCPADTDGGEAYTCLVGLPLVPVSDGTLQSFGKPKDKVSLFLGSGTECELLATLRSRIVDVSLPASVGDHFRSEALQAYTNVRQLTPGMVAECLDQVLPQGWKGKGEVVWKAGQGGHPTEEWVGLLWKYLCGCEGGIGAFVGWPLIPTVEGTLCLLSEDGGKVVDGGSVLGERLRGLLSAVGCRMLDGERIGRREAVAGYVQKATLRGVLAAMYMGCDGRFEQIVEALSIASGGDKRELRAFFGQRRWLNEESCSREDAVIVMSLPIHEVYGEGECFQALDGSKRLPPAAVTRELLTEDYVRAETEAEADMYRFLGVKTASLSRFYTDSVIPKLNSFVGPKSEAAAISMLEALSLLSKEDPNFVERLAELPFVTTASGKLARPRDLYDPNVGELQELLDGGDFYPSNAFMAAGLSATLVRLGLQTKLNAEGVLKVARSISQKAVEEGQRDQSVAARGKSLLTYMDKHAKRLEFEKLVQLAEEREEYADFREEICSLYWAPVMAAPPMSWIPWREAADDSEPQFVAPPRRVRTNEDTTLVSSVYGICSVPIKSTTLMTFLGWCDPVTPVVIAQQLLRYSTMYGTATSLSPLSQPTTARASLPEEVRRTVLGIYDALAMQTMAESFDQVCRVLSGQRCVLLDADEFVASDKVAFECEADLTPLLHAFPEGLEGYESLFAILGVRARFSAKDLCSGLQVLAYVSEGQPLEPEQVDLVVRLSREAAQRDVSEEDRGLICLPDTQGVMFPAEDLVYDDAAWLSSTLQDVRFLHQDISNEVAAALGLGSVRKLLLAGRVNVRDLACPKPSLLNAQLASYPGHAALLSRLIDLADCLGSRSVHILLDFRTHPSHSILQPNLDVLHGPAIVVHIDGVQMGPEQLCKLQTLEPSQQGLRRVPGASPGLNSVYSVTDVPCIISGEGLYFFDPKGTHFIDATNSHPTPVGKAHLFVNSQLPKRFPDQFAPFEVFGFCPSNKFAGTILRLPLRTSGQSSTQDGDSALQVTCTEQDMEEMLEGVGESIGTEGLLFMETLDNITVSSWRKDEAEMKLEFKSFLQPPVSQPLRASRQAMSQNKEWHKFNLMSVFGQVTPIKQCLRVDIITFNAARNATSQEKWLMCQSLGTRQARKMALENKQRGWMPLVSVACLLQRGDEKLPVIDGGFFAYTPVEASGLPVHISAGFELEANAIAWTRPQEADESGSDMAATPTAAQELPVAWNKELSSCAVEVYVDLLRYLPDMVKQDPALMYRAWPTSDKATPFTSTLLKPLYTNLAQQQLFLVHGGQLAKMQGGVFKPTEASESLRLLFRGLFPMFACPSALLEEFKKAGVPDVSEITPERVRRRLKKDPKIVDACVAHYRGDRAADLVSFITDALEYCLLDLSARGQATYRELSGIKLLPMSGGQLLCFPFEAFVASEEEQRLVPSLKGSFVDPRCSDRLRQWFTAPDFLQALSLRRFTPAVLSANLGAVLPRHFKGQQMVPAYSASDSSGLPPPKWLHDLWWFVGPDNAHLFNAWPVVPLTTGALASVSAMSSILNLPPTISSHVGPPDAQTEPLPLFPFSEEAPEGATEDATVQHAEFLRSHPVGTGLQRLGCPVVHPLFAAYVPRGDPERLAASSLAVLSAVATSQRLGSVPLSAAESRALFGFMAREHGHRGFTPQESATLRTLPIFETRSGAFVPLVGNDFFICPPDMSAAVGHDALLKHQHPAFYEFLGVEELDETALLEKFTLPSFASLDRSQQAEAVEKIRKHWARINERPALLDKLRSLQFVETHGVLLRPDQLFDPRKKLLKTVFGDDPVFPTGKFESDEWLPMLRVLGLQSHINADVFVQCARRVQRLYADALADADSARKEQAVGVATDLSLHLVDNFASMNTPEFCSEVSGVPFVPVKMPDGQDSLVRFSDACVPAERVLVWAVMPVLKPCLKLNDVMRERLRVLSPPPPAMVIANLLRINAETLVRWPLEERVTTVFQRLFDFVWERWGDVGAEDKQALRSATVIPAGGELVKASRVFFRLQGSYAPFMFELPRCFGAQEALLRELGVREAPSTADLTHFLTEVGVECAGSPLNPNELSAVVRVLESLSNAGYRPDSLRPLLIPDTAGALVPAHSCFRCEDVALLRRVDAGLVHLASPLLTREVCESGGVLDLATALQERLEEGEGEVLFVRGEEEDRMAERLHCTQLADAIESLCSGQGVQADSAHAFLAKYSVRIVRRLETRLILPSGEDVTCQEGSRVAFFLDRGKSRVLLSQHLPPGVDLHHALAAAVDRLFEGKMSRDHFALSVLLASSPFSMPAAAAMLGLGAKGGSGVGEVQQRAMPGSRVEGQDEELLCLRPLHRFFQGEVVAFRGDDGALRYASVVDDGGCSSEGPDGDDAGAPAVRRLVLRTGPKGTATVLSSSVYCFRSTARGAGGGGGGGPRTPRGGGGGSLAADPDQAGWGKGGGGGAAARALGVGVGAATPEGGGADAGAGPASAAEVAEAVGELLGRLNVPLSLDKAKMLEQLVGTQRELQDAQKRLSAASKGSQLAERQAARMRELCTCPITQEIMRDPVTASDGHVYERSAITRCLQAGAPSPLTRQELSPTLVSSHAHKALCRLVNESGK